MGTDRDLVVTSAAEMRAQARAVLAEIFSLAYAQVAAALAVAFLGVLNTLWISVVLRRRELGLLRSVGATQSQVVRSIVIEAAVLGVIGAVLGLVGGAIVEWVLLRRILPADTGWTYPLAFPWVTAAGVAVLAILTSALAGWFPARAAVRVPIADALKYE
jgi:putative ABC transport system permease protein